MLEAAVDGLRRPVQRAGAVEVGQDVASSAAQGPSKGDQLAQHRWHVVAEGVNDVRQGGLAGLAVGVSVGGDDALVDAPGRLDLEVGVVGEGGGEALVLSVGEQVGPGAQHPPDPVEGVPGASAVTAGFLLQLAANGTGELTVANDASNVQTLAVTWKPSGAAIVITVDHVIRTIGSLNVEQTGNAYRAAVEKQDVTVLHITGPVGAPAGRQSDFYQCNGTYGYSVVCGA